MKAKPIRPTLRGKRRYLAIQIRAAEALDIKAVRKALNRSFLQAWGFLGLSAWGINYIDHITEPLTLILSCNDFALPYIRSALLFFASVDGTAVLPKIVFVSGSLKKLKRQIV